MSHYLSILEISELHLRGEYDFTLDVKYHDLTTQELLANGLSQSCFINPDTLTEFSRVTERKATRHITQRPNW